MKFHLDTAQLFIPDGIPEKQALKRTSHLGICAHQDDLEIMAIDGILQCYQQPERWFTAVVVTNGAGSARDGLYKDFTDEQMRLVRTKEQVKAAFVGEYAAMALLDYPSSVAKDSTDQRPVEDLIKLLEIAQPETVYTHNLADKHPTHVAAAVRAIHAIRRLPQDLRPKRLFGCEVWRTLNWMLDEDKVLFDVSEHECLQAALVGIYDSQITGGKRYDLATMGQRKANATYLDTHGVDKTTGTVVAMDLSPLIHDDSLSLQDYVTGYVLHFAEDVRRIITSVE